MTIQGALCRQRQRPKSIGLASSGHRSLLTLPVGSAGAMDPEVA